MYTKSKGEETASFHPGNMGLSNATSQHQWLGLRRTGTSEVPSLRSLMLGPNTLIPSHKNRIWQRQYILIQGVKNSKTRADLNGKNTMIRNQCMNMLGRLVTLYFSISMVCGVETILQCATHLSPCRQARSQVKRRQRDWLALLLLLIARLKFANPWQSQKHLAAVCKVHLRFTTPAARLLGAPLTS